MGDHGNYSHLVAGPDFDDRCRAAVRHQELSFSSPAEPPHSLLAINHRYHQLIVAGLKGAVRDDQIAVKKALSR